MLSFSTRGLFKARHVDVKASFLDKLFARLDQVEPEEIARLVQRLIREKGFMERVFASLQEGLTILDTKGFITFINPSACHMFGIEESKCLGKPIGKVLRGLDWKSLSQKKGVISKDLEIFYPQASTINFYLAPIEGEGETPLLGYLLLFRDVTHSRQRTQEAIEQEKMQALTMLAAGVAHEIGNPLNSLAIHLQLLNRQIGKIASRQSEKMAYHLGIIEGEVARLDGLLKHFLQAIRPTMQEKTPHNINILIEESVELLAPEIESQGSRVVLHLASHPPLIPLDGDQIKQAFYNVVKNSLQALRPQEGVIVITSSFDDACGRVSFSDNGEGIEAETMAHLFEPFMTTKPSGNGLGLLIIRRIVREHGGNVQIESEKGEGTTLTMSFPRHRRRMRLLEDAPVIDISP